jgi:hypothetical protein
LNAVDDAVREASSQNFPPHERPSTSLNKDDLRRSSFEWKISKPLKFPHLNATPVIAKSTFQKML